MKLLMKLHNLLEIKRYFDTLIVFSELHRVIAFFNFSFTVQFSRND